MESFVEYNDCLLKSEHETQTTSTIPPKVNNLSLVVLMGIPASGKSTLATKIEKSILAWRTIVMSFDDYVPLHVQAEVSKYLSGENDENAGNDSVERFFQVSYAKVLRKKFIHCIETVAKFVTEIRNERQNMQVDKYLQSLNEALSSYASTELVSNESFVLKVENIIKTIVQLCTENADAKVVIVVDDNNYYHSMRNDFYQVAKQLEIGFCVVFCKSALKTCVQRNSSRPVELLVPHKVIVEMSLKFEAPDPMRNAADMYCVEINLNDQCEINLVTLETVIQNSMYHPLKKNDDLTQEIERERRICSESEIHQADLVLRKWIGKKLNLESISNTLGKSNDPRSSSDTKKDVGSRKKKLSKELIDKKKGFLDKLRYGKLKVSFQVEQDVEFHGEIIRMFENMTLE